MVAPVVIPTSWPGTGLKVYRLENDCERYDRLHERKLVADALPRTATKGYIPAQARRAKDLKEQLSQTQRAFLRKAAFVYSNKHGLAKFRFFCSFKASPEVGIPARLGRGRPTGSAPDGTRPDPPKRLGFGGCCIPTLSCPALWALLYPPETMASGFTTTKRATLHFEYRSFTTTKRTTLQTKYR